jgi:hypothetical protein
MRWFSTVIFALLLVAAVSLRAEEAQQASLKGLTAVRVVVDHPGKETEGYGLTQAALRTGVESRLKKAGITLLSPQERAQGMPYLHLSVAAFPADGPGDDLFVYSIDLNLYQEVRLIRVPSVRVESPTWSAAGTVGTIKAVKLTTLHDTVGHYVDGFVAAHQAANAK